MPTNVPVFNASRLNPELADETDPTGNFVAIDESSGNEWINVNNRMLVLIKNTTVNPITCTFVVVSTYAGIDLPDEVMTVAANDWGIIGPFPNADFGGGASKSVVEIQYTGTTPVGKILILDVKKNDA